MGVALPIPSLFVIIRANGKNDRQAIATSIGCLLFATTTSTRC